MSNGSVTKDIGNTQDLRKVVLEDLQSFRRGELSRSATMLTISAAKVVVQTLQAEIIIDRQRHVPPAVELQRLTHLSVAA